MGSTVFYESASETATLGNTFSVAGTATDPTAVTLVVTTPAGVPTTYTWPTPATITHGTPGVFSKDIACSESGTWQYVWTGTGTAADVVAGTWSVSSANLQNLYCTPEMLRSRTGISDTLDDAEILGACRSVSRWIDQYCDRRFNRRTATKTFRARDWYCVPVPDLVSVTTLKTDAAFDGTFETTWSSSTDYQLLPANAAAELEPGPYTEIRAVGSLTFPVPYSITGRREGVEIVGVWGWPAVPEPVAEAARILAGDYLKLGSMSFGVAGYGDYGAVRARLSSPAMSMLDPYRRNPILVA